MPQGPSPASDVSEVLVIALPIALVSILIVAVIAIISVLLCWHFYHKNKRYKLQAGYIIIRTMNMTYTPSLYRLESSNASNDDRTLKHVKNALYVPSSSR